MGETHIQQQGENRIKGGKREDDGPVAANGGIDYKRVLS
jgi:hypothetical protein